jgi:hypothetical protein
VAAFFLSAECRHLANHGGISRDRRPESA